MKLRFMNGRCLNAPTEHVRNEYPEMVLWREAFERDEYVRLTFRAVSELTGSPEIFPGILRTFSSLIQQGVIVVHGLDNEQVVSVLAKPFEHTARIWTVRVFPTAPDVRMNPEWHSLRIDLLTIESELFHRQSAQPT